MSKGMRSGISWLFLLTIGFSLGAEHFSNLYNSPPSSSEYFQVCANSPDPTTCAEGQLPLYQKTNQQEEHWATVMIALAGISGIFLLCTVVVAIQEHFE